MNDTMVISSDIANGTLAMNGTELLIPGTDILQQLDVSLPFYGLYLLLIGSGLIYRLLAYYALRYLHRDHKS